MGCGRSIIAILLASLLAGCAFGDDRAPYVFIEQEFDRDRPGFGREPSDRSEVWICYNKLYTTPETVRELAVAECGHFGKDARLIDQSILSCTLSHPVRANYACLAR
jgi:hypothetical protein